MSFKSFNSEKNGGVNYSDRLPGSLWSDDDFSGGKEFSKEIPASSRYTSPEHVRHASRMYPSPQKTLNDETKDYRKDFQCHPTFAKLVRLFFNDTSAHGFAHAWNNRRSCFGIFWLIVVILFSGTMMVITVLTLRKFNQRQILSETTINRTFEGLQLPSIVICNRGFFAKDKVDAMGITETQASYLLIASSSPIYRHPNAEDRTLNSIVQELQDVMDKKNLTLRTLIEKISLTCEEMVGVCRLGPYDYQGPRECCRSFTRHFTTLGVCFASQSNESIIQSFEGEHSGISIHIKHRNNNDIDFNSSIVNVAAMARQGIQLSVLNNVTHPSVEVSGRGFMVVSKFIYSLQLSLTKINNRYLKTWLDTSEKPCIEVWDIQPWHLDEYFDNTPNCLVRRIRNLNRKICNCTFYPFSTPYDNDTCTLEMTRVCWETAYSKMMKNGGMDIRLAVNAGKNCRPLCEEDTFKFTSTSSPMHPRSMETLQRRYKSENSSLSIVDIYYPMQKYTHVWNYRSEIKDVIASLGGQMGLLMGCSLISGIEASIFMLVSLWLLALTVVRRASRICRRLTWYH